MNFETLLSDYGLLILVLAFIIISLYFKNFINIGVFLVLFVGLRNIFGDHPALLYSYCLAILFGIFKNFHLLENFSGGKNDSVVPGKRVSVKELIEANNNNVNILRMNKEVKRETEKNKNKSNNNKETGNKNSKKGKNVNKNIKISKEEKKQIVDKVEAPDMDEIISKELINKFIKRLKKEDNLLVTREKINMYKISPTINKLSKNKVEKIKRKMLDDDNFHKQPIVITNDLFILDGHHRWYAKKSLVENNTNGYNLGEIYNEDIQVVKIDYDIKKCVNKLQEYKIKYNKDYLNKTIKGINNISNGRKYIDEIKDMIDNLEENYNNFANVELV